MARLLLTALLATVLLAPASAEAHPHRPVHHSARTVTHTGASHHHAASAAQLQTQTKRAALQKLAGQGPVVLATAIAENYWNAVPCSGQITVLANLPVPSGMEAGTDGWVTFGSSLGENDLEAPADTYTRCTISLAHWQWPTQKSMVSDWNMFCLTVTHEVGHLLGYKHTLIPGSVMAPVFVNETNVPSICRQTRPLGAGDLAVATAR